jgi:peptide/nickel transport system ATP-binding protein
MSLAVEHLTVRYRAAGGAVTALSDVSFDVNEGRTLAVVGESGSGKSTIALAMMGLLGPEAEIVGGRILFEGSDLLTLDAEKRRRIRGARMAIVFQDPFAVLNPSLPIGEQIGEGLVYHCGLTPKAAFGRALELLREVGIADAATIARAYPHELSGGMRQRALIASALAAEPKLLVLDEPTTALDVTIEAQVLDLFAELKARRHLTVLFITHNLGVVRRTADEIAVLYAGEVVESGTTAQVFGNPVHPYTKGLLAAIPRLDRRGEPLAAIAGQLPDMRGPPAGCRFAPRCPFAVAACAMPQSLLPHDGRTVRCIRAEEICRTPWPRASAVRLHARALDHVGADAPVVAAQGLAKTFTLTRGLGALTFAGLRPVLRPVRVRAVDHVSLTIAAGEIVGLVGESGCGKTTLGRTVLRLVDPDAGTIRIAGDDVTHLPQRALGAMRRAAQIVFQNPDSSLNPRKTVGEIIARPLARFAILPPGEVGRRVAALLDRVRLPAHYVDRYPHQMSGGEKQRVAIARALATEPSFIVCDEPASALDVSVQAAIVGLLAELRERMNVAYLFISHDIALVAHLADRIAVMYRGRIVEIGTTDEVMRPPHHPYTEALLSAVPSIDKPQASRIRLPLAAQPHATAGCCFSRRCPRRIGPICDEQAPPVRSASATHVIACHYELRDLARMAGA